MAIHILLDSVEVRYDAVAEQLAPGVYFFYKMMLKKITFSLVALFA